MSLRAETGYNLWLRYDAAADPTERAAYRRSVTAIVVPAGSPTTAVIAEELARGLSGLLGNGVPRVDRPQAAGISPISTAATPARRRLRPAMPLLLKLF